MTLRRESVRFKSLGEELVGVLFLPENKGSLPALIICHGAGEFKENYFEMCEFLGARGLICLAMDMHGHGESEGARFFVEMEQWVPDIQAAIDFLLTRSEVDSERIGAFGLSSGGTAILEAGAIDSRLKALIGLDATVRNSLPAIESFVLKALTGVGKVKRKLTGREMRVPLAKISVGPKLASDPEVNKRLLSDPHSIEAFLQFPMPGGEQAFFVDTITRVDRIQAPTLVIWGEDDKVDPPETAHLLSDALRCKKRLEIIPGNGHVGHLDRNREKVFELTATWALEHLQDGPVPASRAKTTVPSVGPRIIEGDAAKQLSPLEKWELLAPFLKRFGRSSLAYATLQQGMEYFIDETGYIAYTTVQHPVFSPKPRRITLCEPICSTADLPKLLERFFKDNPRVTFAVVSEQFAEVGRSLGFKANCIGYEPELTVQTYNTEGNWKELDLIKRARNEAKREGLVIREESPENLDAAQLAAVSKKWISNKKINDREIWLYARRPVFGFEEDVRKFVAYDRQGTAVGFVFYDPMYRDGQVYGYSANIVRCDEKRYGRLATAIHMTAMEKFKQEGKEVLNLLLAPFVKLNEGKFNDDLTAKWFFQLSARFGNDLYNFKGLSFHKSKYRGVERPLYCLSNSLLMSNDLFLAFMSADIARSYFSTIGQLLRGMLPAKRRVESA